eukprot:11203848-Alexandrium_andersonii.AAC.1
MAVEGTPPPALPDPLQSADPWNAAQQSMLAKRSHSIMAGMDGTSLVSAGGGTFSPPPASASG